MKKFLIAAVVSVAMLAATVPAHADNSEEVIIGILGGALGGLVIGSALSRDRVIVRERYIYEEPVVAECYTKVVRVWDPARDRYVKVRKTICN
jgi:NhaP-type Na+/H+ or K+/H+ antiporter